MEGLNVLDFFTKPVTENATKRLKVIQSSLIDDGSNIIIKRIIAHNFIPSNLWLLRIKSNTFIDAHTDDNEVTINIGLKNSKIGNITFSDSYNSTLETFWKNPTNEFKMQDGDVFALNVEQLHSVSTAKLDNITFRYIISYNLRN